MVQLTSIYVMRYFNTLLGARSFKLKTLMLALFCSDRGNYTLDYSYSFHCFAPSFHLMNIYKMRQGCHWIFLQVFLAQFMSVSGHKFAEIAAHIWDILHYWHDRMDCAKRIFPNSQRRQNRFLIAIGVLLMLSGIY